MKKPIVHKVRPIVQHVENSIVHMHFFPLLIFLLFHFFSRGVESQLDLEFSGVDILVSRKGDFYSLLNCSIYIYLHYVLLCSAMGLNVQKSSWYIVAM